MEEEAERDPNTIFQLRGFDKALKKVLALSQRDGTHGYFETPFLFRGQPNNKDIVSTLFRDKLEYEVTGQQELEYAFHDEYSSICNWIARANKAGLQFNFDIWPYLNRSRQSMMEFVEGGKNLVRHYPAMSLSRHYGCKNRLIDFTKDRHAGLFFALVGGFEAMEKKLHFISDEDGRISDIGREKFKKWLGENEAVVWVIQEDVLKNSTVLFPDYGNNKFALAQSAVFVLAPISTSAPDFKIGSLNFSNAFEEFGFRFETKIRIPYMSIPHLLKDLENKGINHIRYFPSPESISRNEVFMNRVNYIRSLILGTI